MEINEYFLLFCMAPKIFLFLFLYSCVALSDPSLGRHPPTLHLQLPITATSLTNVYYCRQKFTFKSQGCALMVWSVIINHSEIFPWRDAPSLSLSLYFNTDKQKFCITSLLPLGRRFWSPRARSTSPLPLDLNSAELVYMEWIDIRSLWIFELIIKKDEWCFGEESSVCVSVLFLMVFWKQWEPLLSPEGRAAVKRSVGAVQNTSVGSDISRMLKVID